MIVYLDIETLPNTSKEVREELALKVKPPGSYKKAESIAEWWKTEGDKAIDEAVLKTSFDGLYGRICCISFAVDDGEIVSFYDDNESVLLSAFYLAVFNATKVQSHGTYSVIDPTFCGHNIAGFDLPFIKARSIINEVKPPSNFMKAFNAKPWSQEIADTMLMWNSDREKRVSLDKLCKALGIPGKGDFDGSMVAETWKTNPEKVIAYCQDDVERTRRIYKKLTWQN